MARRYLLAALLLAACSQSPPPVVKPKVASPKPAASTKAVLVAGSPTPTPAATPAGLDPVRQASLLDALSNAAAASRAAKVTSTMGDISGVLSNNAAGIISDNGSGIISDNGSGLLSNNGGSYRLTSTATPTPGPLDEAFVPLHFTSETPTLVYKIDADQPTKGGFKSYEKAGFKAGKLDEALVDDFSWDDVDNTQGFGGQPDVVAFAYHLVRNSSKRLPFGDRFISREIIRVAMNAAGDGVTSKTIGWEVEFALDVALAAGALDRSSFKAVAGEKDLTILPASNGGDLALPNNLVLTGKNDRGTYAGKLVSKDGQLDVQVTHTGAKGEKTDLTIAKALDGTTHQVVAVPGAHLTLTADIDAQGGGKGVLEDTTGAKPFKLGDVSWDADGLATIKLADGGEVKARLF